MKRALEGHVGGSHWRKRGRGQQRTEGGAEPRYGRDLLDAHRKSLPLAAGQAAAHDWAQR